MNGFHYVMGGVYCTPCEFASVGAFQDLVEPRFADLPFARDPVLERLHSLVGELEEPTETVGDEKARDLLVARDLRRVAEFLSRRTLHDPNRSLPENRACFEVVLRELGLEFASPKLFVVDSFPKPYDAMDWTATSPDRADQESYGIEPGNYFKRKFLIPYRSDFLLAHEMIHQVVSGPDPYLLGRGLEEGIAVAFGELYVGARVLGADLAYQYALYHWFDAHASRVNRLYGDYARMAAAIYERYGLAGLLALVRGGRRKIKQAERECLAGNLDLDLPCGGWDEAYTASLRRLTMTTVSHLVVSPLAKYVAGHVHVGATVADVSAASRVPPDAVSTALGELQQEVFLVVEDNGRIDYSDVDVVDPSRLLRYDW